MPPTILEKINTDLSANLYTPAGDNDQTFIVGTASDDNYKPNNYLWYSGKMWRIVALNKTDGLVTSIKLITQDLMTTVHRNGSVVNGGSEASAVYEGSFIYQWYEDFYEALRNPTSYLVANYSWNATQVGDNSKPPNTTMVTAPVGTLNNYEYVKSYTNTTGANGYLNIGYQWWLINPHTSTSNAGVVLSSGSTSSAGYSSSYSIRPAINLKSNLFVSKGNGTISNPYSLVGDNDQEVNLLNKNLNTRYSGEYVRFNNEDYRIVKVENGLTKLIKIDYIRNGETVITKSFGTSNAYSQSILDGVNYWGGYLNNDTTSGWYGSLSSNNQNMIETGTWYFSGIVAHTASYKKSICETVNPLENGGTLTQTCDKTTTTATAKIGLLRLGEIFATQIGDGSTSSSNIELLSPTAATSIHYVTSTGAISSQSVSNVTSTRLTFYLKSSVKIASGDGTPSNPFTIAMA